MVDIKQTQAQDVLEEVRTSLTVIIPHISSLCYKKTLSEIEKILENSINDALNELFINRYKQHVWNATKDIIVNIEYVNEKKKRSIRKIKVERIQSSEKNTTFLIDAYCYLRKMHRCFKADNIEMMYYENGEIITIDDLIKQMKEISN